MTYSDALDYLYSRLPVFHRIGPKAIKPGLGNIRRLCDALGNPQQQFRSIHVGGTNGKGSTAHMLAAVYQSAGYRVGLYTSPHLKSFTERIRVSGQPIGEEAAARFVTQHQSLIEAVEPSFFEVTVAMAFDYFVRQRIDLAIVEVGLGGRLDSTNIITPVASVITNIGFDHTDLLGDTLPLIAGEKAGIIKTGVPVVIGETQPETAVVFQETAALLNAPILFADQRYKAADRGLLAGLRQVSVSRDGMPPLDFSLDLTGGYQVRNLLAVLATIDVLQPLLPVTVFAQRDGLQAVTRTTGLKGRFQTMQTTPTVIADTAHNPPGLAEVFRAVRSQVYTNLHVIIGLVADKERERILLTLPKDAVYYFCQAQTPRSLPAETLRDEARQYGLTGAEYPNVNSALAVALQESIPSDLILITGSNYIIAELTHL